MDSINGTAKEGQDYVKVKEIIEFQENEEEKEVNNGFVFIFFLINNFNKTILS